jgi:TonB family protein
VQAVRVGLTINPFGKVQDCRIEVSSGNPPLDRHACGIMKGRARFRPARISGEPAYGIYRTSLSWWVGDGFPPPAVELPDLDVDVPALPPKVKSPLVVRITYAVDALGRSSGCEAEGKKDNPELVVASFPKWLSCFRQ